MLINYAELLSTLEDILIDLQFEEENARINAEIFAKSTLDGYHSHGINRFGEFVKNVHKGIIRPNAKPTLMENLGPIARFDGQWGPGPSNAYRCMQYAINSAKENVLACAALINTNHWMRGGSYGWQAAESGCITISFTNTMPNMPPWGGTTVTTGNNPLIIAVPRKEGHIVLDMSMSQFSYGKMYEHRLKGKQLPFAGGFDDNGIMTADPDAIIKSRRILQTGYWKGSGLSIIIDLLASLLSGGNSTADIGKLEAETSLSQVFICINRDALGEESELASKINEVIEHFQSANRQQEDQPIRYPGEATIIRRKRQLSDGIFVEDDIWKQVIRMQKEQ